MTTQLKGSRWIGDALVTYIPVPTKCRIAAGMDAHSSRYRWRSLTPLANPPLLVKGSESTRMDA